MTEHMRKALEQIASGIGPLGARLGYDQLREIAREAITAQDVEDDGLNSPQAMIVRDLLK